MMRIFILLLVPLLVIGSSAKILKSDKRVSEVSQETTRPNEDSVKIKREPQHGIHGHALNSNIGGKGILGGGPQLVNNDPHTNLKSSGFISGSFGGLNQGGVDITQNAGVGHVEPINIPGSIGGLGHAGLQHGNVVDNAGSSHPVGAGLANSAALGSLSGINFGFSNTQDPSLLGGNALTHILDTGIGEKLPHGNFGRRATTPILLVLYGNQLPFNFNTAGLGAGALQGSGGFTELNNLGGQVFGQYGGFIPAELQHSLAVQLSQLGFGNLGHQFDLGGRGTLGQGIQGTFGQGGVDFAGGKFVGNRGFGFGNLGLVGGSLGVGETALQFGNQGLGTGGGGFALGGGQETLGQVGKGAIEQGGQGIFGHGGKTTLGQGGQEALGQVGTGVIEHGGQGAFGQGVFGQGGSGPVIHSGLEALGQGTQAELGIKGQGIFGHEGKGLLGQGVQTTFGHGDLGVGAGSFVGSESFGFGNQGLTSGSFGVGGPTFHLGEQSLGTGGDFSLGGFGSSGFGFGPQGVFDINQGLSSNVGGQSLFLLDPSQYSYGIHAANILPLPRSVGFINQRGSNLNGVGFEGGRSINTHFSNRGDRGFQISQDHSGGHGNVVLNDRHHFDSGSSIYLRNRGKNPVKFHGSEGNQDIGQRYGIPSPTIVRALLTGHKTDDGGYKQYSTHHQPQSIPRYFGRYSARPSYDRFRRKKNIQKQEEKEQKE